MGQQIMSIPESQLETWSHQGAVKTASSTYESIRSALLAASLPARNNDLDIYLQGSYRNSTNIRGDSDVDIVVQLNSIWHADTSRLPADQLSSYQAAISTPSYTWADFRHDVLEALRSRYGVNQVSEGNKSLKVAANGTRLAADVVACIQHRLYLKFHTFTDQDFIEGIAFWTQRSGRLIVNYPKAHYLFGVDKNGCERTNGLYKPIVRIFKNARSKLVEDGLLALGTAPSYYVECLLYNVDDSLFSRPYNTAFLSIMEWILKSELDKMTCQNSLVPLFGSSPEQWNINDAQVFIRALWTLWQHF